MFAGNGRRELSVQSATVCLEEVAAAEKPKESPSKNLLKHKKTGRIAMTENIFPLPCLTYFSPAVGFVPAPTTLCALVSTRRGTGSSVELVRCVTRRPPFLNKIDKCLLAAENPGEVHRWREAA